MALEEILNEDIIDLNLKAATKDEVLHELAGKLKDAAYIDNVEGFVKDIYVRESEGITGMGNHIAIPHGKSSSVTKIGIAIGRTDKEVEWESYDGQPVNLIFLFCVSDNGDFAKNHMMLLAELAGKLGNDVRVKKLQEAQSKKELLHALLCDEEELEGTKAESNEEIADLDIDF